MQKNKTLILRVNNTDYFFPFLREYDFFSCYKKSTTFFERSVGHILNSMKIPEYIIYDKWKFNIEEYNSIIIFDYGYTEFLSKYIKKRNPKCKIHVFFFNKAKEVHMQKVQDDKNVDCIWSFDPGDVEKYRIRYNTTMYPKALTKIKKTNIVWDVVFVGAEKGRQDEINMIDEACREQGIKTCFKVAKNNSEYISYNECIELVCGAKCILDVTIEGQRGLTLRFMESLFLTKKLITNNREVMNYEFYNPQNIFIMGVDDIKCLKSFIESPYCPIDECILEYYDFGNWLNRFQI